MPHEDGHIRVGESGGHMGSSSFLELYTIFFRAHERKLELFFKSFNDNEDWVRSQLAESNTGKSPITARPKNKAKANMKNYQCASLTQQ